MNSPLYTYIKNQYLLGKFTDDEMTQLVVLGRITNVEKQEIVSVKAV